MLLIVDPQIDFISGSLPVEGAGEAMDALAGYLKSHAQEYAVRVATSDWHPYHHVSFDREGGPWPPHCVQHSAGAALWPKLIEALNQADGGFTLLYKGDQTDREEYSIMQNSRSADVIDELVQTLRIGQIDLCGIAGNICVMNTAIDLLARYGASMLRILLPYTPSFDDGSKLQQFIQDNGIETC